MKRIRLTIVIVLALSIVLLAVRTKWYLKNPRWKPDGTTATLLSKLGDSALLTADMPVAAVLLYNNAILGTGYNTVRKDLAAAGHAEINAISNSIRATGLDSFMKLDRSRLVLITTWEPCPMCRGAIIEYHINHVKVIKAKPMSYWYNQWTRGLGYEWNKEVAESDTLEEQLFRKHPLYNANAGNK